MNYSEFIAKFLDWSETSIEAKQDSGFPVCPYARKARLQKENTVYRCS